MASDRRLRRILKVLGVTLAVLAVLIIGLVIFVQLTWDRPVSREVRQLTAPADSETIARGEFLYKYGLNCWGCHGSEGSKSPDEQQGGGLEFDLTGIGLPGGFGYVYASNLTPDPETGLGDWTDGEIVRAVREGLDREGNVLFPLMETEFWHGMSDEDALALVAYLRSLDPVRNEVPAGRLTLAARAMIAAVVRPQSPVTEPVTAPPRGPTAEYGEYVAWRASGCGGCHTPRSQQTGQYDFSQPLAGTLFPFPEERFSVNATNLTPDEKTGIGDWTEEQFMTAMRTGVRPDGTVMLPFMPYPSYAQWSEDDLRAVWLYLRTLEPIQHEVEPATLTGAAATGTGADRGRALFEVYCLVCHGEQGRGAPFTSVALRDVADRMDDVTLSRFVSEGISGTRMPAFDKTLTSEEIEDLILYIRTW